MAAKVTRLHTAPPARTVRAAAETFLDTIGSANTRRAYAIAIVKTVDQLDGRGPDGLIGHSRALDSVTDAEVGAALETLWGEAAVNTWNARRATVGEWLSWCAEQGWTAPTLPVSAARSTAGLRHPSPVAHRDRPSHRPPRCSRAGEDAVADAV